MHLRALERIAERNGGDRAAGTPGYDASVAYVARRLRAAGWRVRLEAVPMAIPSERRASRLSVDGTPLRRVKDFRTLTYSGAGRARGIASPVGTGCRASDFAGFAPGGVALAAQGACLNFVRAVNARRAGAVALLVEAEAGRRGVASATLTSPVRLPALRVREGQVEPGDAVALRVDSANEHTGTRNVIAEAGRGERLAMAGAHLDSVPDGPGINDNASGVAVLLEAARALGSRPRKHVRLAFWGGEELGLHGSRRHVSSLSRGERRALLAYLNLDMVGSPNAVPAVYSDGDRRLTALLRRVHPGRERGVAAAGRSDHAPFQGAGVPVAGLYTGADEPGPGGRPRDPCYHLPCDTLENINATVLLRMARATVAALREVEDQP